MVKKYKDYGKSYSEVYDLITSHKNYLNETKNLLLFLNLHLKEKKILSIGCGTGNHEKIISNKGFKIFGIDNSTHMLKQANLKKKNRICEFGSNFDQALKFFGNNKLSCVISLFNCVNCLLDEKSLTRFIADIRYHLDKKSCFFFEAWNGEECLANPPQQVTRNYKSDNYNITRVATPKMFFKKKEIEIKYHIFGHIKKSEINFISKHKIKLYSAETIINVLKKTGFSNVNIFSALPNLQKIKKNKLKGNRMLAFYAVTNK